jgi:hypothetical protein
MTSADFNSAQDDHHHYLTAAEAARFLRLSPITLSRWRLNGYGPSWTKMGPKRVCYSLAELKAFASAQRRSSTSGRSF